MSRQQSCASNEKQLGLAIFEYSEDYDNKFPDGTHPAPLQSISPGWVGQIYSYIVNAHIFNCPDDPTQAGNNKPYEVPISYAYNWNIGNTSLAIGNRKLKISSASTKQLNDPARTVLLCEAIGTTVDFSGPQGIEASSPTVLGNRFTTTSSINGNGDGLLYATGVFRSDPASAAVVGTQTGNVLADPVHTGGSNVLFADGHEHWERPGSVSAGLSNRAGSEDCTAGQGFTPIGKAGNGYAAGTACLDQNMKATFSIY